MPLPAAVIPIIAAIAGGVASSGANKFFSGSDAERENVSTLLPEQQEMLSQLRRALESKGGGGAFGQTADYYRDLMSGEGRDFQEQSAPTMRQYNEEIVPGLSEQFAGMGAGGLSSSGFRNAQISGAVDLSERLAGLRANLRQQGAAGLANMAQSFLNPYSQNMQTKAGSEGFLSSVAPAIGKAAIDYGSNYLQNMNQSSPGTPGAAPPTTPAPSVSPAASTTPAVASFGVNPSMSPYQSTSSALSPYGMGKTNIPASPMQNSMGSNSWKMPNFGGR